ncbi:hypothetical protein ACEK07_13735 [Alcanivoracaceae bacterium MT1]
MTFAAQPRRELTAEEIRTYQEDGVIMLKQALAPNWMAMVEASIEEARNKSSFLGKFMSRKVEGYQMDIFLWKRIDILPTPDPKERIARLQPERAQFGKLAASGIGNAIAAARQTLRPKPTGQLKQTWTKQGAK